MVGAMNGEDREFIEERMNRIEKKLDANTVICARLDERWKMVGKVAGLVGGLVSLIITVAVRILWR